MKVKFIEASHCLNPPSGNWGKFMVATFDAEWEYESALYPGSSMLEAIGWRHSDFLWVVDLQTGEGAFFKHGGLASSDLTKHQIWVCPLFEPFLQWLYTQDVLDISKLPSTIELPNAEFDTHGYRRPGTLPAQDDEEPHGDYENSPDSIVITDYMSYKERVYTCCCGVTNGSMLDSAAHLMSMHGIPFRVAYDALRAWRPHYAGGRYATQLPDITTMDATQYFTLGRTRAEKYMCQLCGWGGSDMSQSAIHMSKMHGVKPHVTLTALQRWHRQRQQTRTPHTR